ncbi:MAG: tyrosine-type recombinase/integrase [Methylophaga sp.]
MAGSFITKKVLPSSGEVRYIATITHNSRNHKTKRFKRKTDATIWVARYLADIENFAASGKKPCSVTFERLADDYLKSWSGTDAVREYAVEYFKVYFGSKLLDSITSDDCRKALKKWEQKKPATFNKYKAILAAMFNFAIRKNDESSETYLSNNPAKKVQNKPVNNQRVRYLSDDEKKRLIESCRKIGGRFYLAFLLALSTGLRKSNVLWLRWSDVNFERGLLSIGRTKNGDPITAPVPQSVLNLLKDQHQVGNELIFASTIDPRVPSDFKKQWVNAREMAKIENFRWHDLRHDVASTMAMAGRTMVEIAQILGHRSLQSTQRYTHLSTDHKAAALQSSVGKVLEGVL